MSVPGESLTTSQPGNQVQLLPMTQLAEALDTDDDWTGVTDAASRRKKQNRLNVRAYRRRKALESQYGSSSAPKTKSRTHLIKTESAIPCWVEEQQMVVSFPNSVAKMFNHGQTPLLPYQSAPDNGQSNSPQSRKLIFPLTPDHLITLLQYNALRAILVNRRLLSGLEIDPFPVSDCSSAALHLSRNPLPHTIPPSLHPTSLQLTIPHEGWLDVIPHPGWRDNLLLALGTFDEDDLWADTLGGLFEGFPGDEIEKRGVIAWDPPWDARGWEVSEAFWRKWKWSFEGCLDVLEITNSWRAKRGEEPLSF